MARPVSGAAILVAALMAAAAHVSGQTVQAVIIETAAGPLHARWLDASQPVGTVLLVHQCDRNPESPLTGYEGLAPNLAERRLSSLQLDLRGYGATPAARGGGSRSHAVDIGVAVEYLRRRTGHLPIAIVGASCGGREGLRFANAAPDVRAVVLLSAGLPAALRPRAGLHVFAAVGTSDPYASVKTLEAAAAGSDQSIIVQYDTALHGTPLLGHDATLLARVADWIHARMAAAGR